MKSTEEIYMDVDRLVISLRQVIKDIRNQKIIATIPLIERIDILLQAANRIYEPYGVLLDEENDNEELGMPNTLLCLISALRSTKVVLLLMKNSDSLPEIVNDVL